MSLSTNMLRVLLAKGVDPETILEVSEAAEAERAAEEEARREKRREGNRRRQKAWYDRNVRNNEDNAVIAQDNDDNGVMRHEDREDGAAKKVLEPKKNPSGITTSSTPSGSQVPSPSKPRRFDWPADFQDRFWAAYPRHTDRKKAMVALRRIWAADRVSFDALMAGCHRLASAGIEDRFVPHPTTWLNNERWADEMPARGRPNGRASPTSSTPSFWANDAADANLELNGGNRDTGPFDTDHGSWTGPGREADSGSDWTVSQPSGGDPRRLPTLRVVGRS